MNNEIKQILDEDKPLILQKINFYRVALFFIIGFTIGTIVFFLLGFLVMADTIIVKNAIVPNLLIGLGSACLIGLAISGFVTYLKLKTTSKSNQANIILSNEKIEKIYNCYIKEKSTQLEVRGLNVEGGSGRSDVRTTSLYLRNNLFDYSFVTETWSEYRTTRASGSSNSQTSVTYYVNYVVTKKPSDQQSSGPEIAEVRVDRLGNHRSDFESESIEFNKTFNIMGRDKTVLTKFFTPNQMVKMLELGRSVFLNKKVYIYENGAKVVDSKSTSFGISNVDPHYAIGDFSLFCTSYNSFVKKCIKKVEKDLGIFYKLRKVISPFDFGKE